MIKTNNTTRLLPLLAFTGAAACAETRSLPALTAAAANTDLPIVVQAEQFLDKNDVRTATAGQGSLDMSSHTVVVHLGGKLMPGSHRGVTVASAREIKVSCTNIEGGDFTTRQFSLYAGRKSILGAPGTAEYEPGDYVRVEHQKQQVSHQAADGSTVTATPLPGKPFVTCTFGLLRPE
jgi:hypothetical protein